MGGEQVSKRSIPPKKAIGILNKLLAEARVLPGEPWTSPTRSQWRDTARGALEQAGVSNSLLESFDGSQAMAFSLDTSDEQMRQMANGNLLGMSAVLQSAVEQLGWELEEEEEDEPATKPTTAAQRRLVAIMFTDIVDYSALTQQDENLALDVRKEHMELLRSIFARHGGEEIKTTGDGFLITFKSAVEALHCGIEIQRTLCEHNSKAPTDRRIDHRVALHVGDVVCEEDGDVVGDGVNIASRIAGVATGAEVWFSKQVFDQVRNKIEARILEVGQYRLKGIAEPVPLFKVGKEPPPAGRGKRPTKVLRPSVVILVLLLAVGTQVLLLKNPWLYSSLLVTGKPESAPGVVNKPQPPLKGGQVAPAVKGNPPPKQTQQRGVVDPKDKTNWRKHLRVGMTTADVLRLFGAPDRMTTRGTLEIWDYGSGSISISEGKVWGWDEPE